jgi:DNA-binding NarL/FixJ family response regulator
VIRLLLVDDHPIVRQGLAAVLEDEPDFELAGSAGSGEEALALLEQAQPDVVLLDLEMPGMDGVALIPQLHARRPAARVLVFTAYATDERVFGAIRAGAAGYLLKGAASSEVAQAIRIIHGGESYVEPRIAARLLTDAATPQRFLLTERERAVLRLVAAGMANKQIARQLGISERTVKFHVTSILTKLNADNRAQAVALAVEKGLL